MLTSVYVTKQKMTQAWTKNGKRVPVTVCKAHDHLVVKKQDAAVEVAYGTKKLANINKAQKVVLEKAGAQTGAAHFSTLKVAEGATVDVGTTINAADVVKVGDVVSVQGITKGRGFAGGMKRHGFSGGPKTHGQSDRARAVGSVGAGTTPGRVLKGKRMPGRYGNETQKVTGLVVLHVDAANKEIWLSGPVPGSSRTPLEVSITGMKSPIQLDEKSSGISTESVQSAAQQAESQVQE